MISSTGSMIIPARRRSREKKSVRETIIRIKLTEITDGVSLVQEHLPSTAREFLDLGLIKDGIYKQIEFAVDDVFDICAIINTDLALGVPGEDDDILEHLVKNKGSSPILGN
jgi:uncharacterized protein YutE (UPF0331/DUF86 family)